MKKIFIIPVFAILSLSFVSCEKDQSLDPLPVLVSGSYVRLDITKKRMNFDDLSNTSFGGSLTTPGGQVAKFNLYVRRTDPFASSFGEFKLIRTITSFPTELNITPQDIATALEIPITDLEFADEFRFYGESFDLAGKRSDFYSLSQTIQSNMAFYKEAFRFRTDLTNTAGMDSGELAGFDNYTPQ
ncbi:MAG TPA: hypothetical protein VK476_05195 [Flavobacterium sp.]|nr:hypothetical protein [Flavobacterium sp.]